MKNIIIIPVFFLFISCAIQFFVRASIFDEKTYNKKEDIIISNPPKDKNKLYNIVENYNRQTISYMEIMEYEICRDFYRETMFLTRKYEEGKPYPTMLGEFIFGEKQDTVNHPDAYLLRTYNSKDICGEHYFIIFADDGDEFVRKIDNPEEYYLKK